MRKIIDKIRKGTGKFSRAELLHVADALERLVLIENAASGLTDEQCEQLRSMPGSFHFMLRTAYEAGKNSKGEL